MTPDMGGPDKKRRKTTTEQQVSPYFASTTLYAQTVLGITTRGTLIKVFFFATRSGETGEV